jgi:NAD(P)-dependent dehydrogenase (short-subunit alcohol dehydrogenase family)
VEDQPIALITGGNRGIGFEVCRQLGLKGFHVLLSGRDEAKTQLAVQMLRAETLLVDPLVLDVSSDESVDAAEKVIRSVYGRLDVLVNNAGIHLHKDSVISALPIAAIRETMETNAYGALRTCQAFLPLMKEQRYGRIVNVSSRMGQHSQMNALSGAYRLSKVAVNALTQMLAASVKIPNILINACCPGHVHTDMGGRSAPRSVEEGSDTIVWLATLPEGGPTGKFFRDRTEIDW